MPSDTLIRQLEETRASNIAQMQALLAPSETEKRAPTKEEFEAWTKVDAEVRELDTQLERFREAAAREARAAAARAQTGDTGAVEGNAGARFTITREPTIYGQGGTHSYFIDQALLKFASAGLYQGSTDGGADAAAERMQTHAKQIDVDMPKRREQVERQAAKAFEESFTQSRRDRRALRRMERLGISPFEREKRFISRTDGQGGFFVPPLWLIDEYIPYLRAGRVFADMWRKFPLPAGTDSINIPRVTLGTATGPQTGDGAPLPGRDMTDSFVNARIVTVAGQQDAAIQLLDQSPIAFDELIFGDLMADLAMQLSGQLIAGAGFPQLNGLYQAGTLGTSTGFGASGYVVNNAAAAWTAPSGTANFYLSLGQLISVLSRTRFRPPTGLITNGAAWYGMATAMDSQNRPLVVPSQQGNNFNQAAGDDDGPISEGPVGHILGVGWTIDPNIPLTFGGTTPPYIGTISNGSTALVPGAGGNPVYTPAIAAIWDDLYLWEGELRSRTLSEVLSGSLQVRFQVYEYAASMANRYQNSSGQPISYGNYNTVGTQATVLSQGTGGLLVGF